MKTQRPTAESLIVHCTVGGKAFDHAENQIAVVDPATARTITSVADVGKAGVSEAVKAASGAMDAWAALAPRDRASLLLKLADAVEEHATELSAIEALDVGKPLHLVPGEIASSVDKLRFFAGGARLLSGVAANEYRPPYTSFVRREPVGVVAALAPWNYPFAMAVWKIGPALAAGNTVVLKPSPETPLSTLRLAQLAAEIFPPGVINVITGGSDVGRALVGHPDVAMISLTGGTATGKAVMASAAKTVRPLHLELGGNAAMLIFDDADLDRLRDMYFMAAFRNSGQDCHAASRIYTTPALL
ncbi:MAG: aldehyde dehydrogenase family protein, partial [Actinomycetes bacterium]